MSFEIYRRQYYPSIHRHRKMKKTLFVGLRILSDLLCFAAVFTAMGILQNIEPYRKGYFANDESIRYPFHSSTVPSLVLYAVSSVITVVVIVVVEVIIARDYLSTKRRGIPLVLYAIYDHLIVSFFGYFLTIAITDVGKVAVGRLRPNFVDVCQPTPTQTTPLGYIFPYTCAKGTTSTQRDILKSFPSGHSSTAMYSAVFLCIYFQLRWPRLGVPAVRVGLQAICVSLGLAVCLSRIVDNKHHWSDVLSGGTLGTTVAITVPFFVPQFYFSESSEDEEVEPEFDTDLPMYDRNCVGHLEFGRPSARVCLHANVNGFARTVHLTERPTHLIKCFPCSPFATTFDQAVTSLAY
ncbi:Lipid phosphate phosphatase [Fasciola gigantica]|uniref:Lipid phosphate phosphatase n=1 Tax=Fasciola gigantica TaxID=46835 RepID=A0A504YFG9_FASGI|nr:Lipid phosphate phosphatase [Fasciola gigantica]